jgi:hypothetical protein
LANLAQRYSQMPPAQFRPPLGSSAASLDEESVVREQDADGALSSANCQMELRRERPGAALASLSYHQGPMGDLDDVDFFSVQPVGETALTSRSR